MPQLPKGWTAVDDDAEPPGGYRVPFKDGFRPATRQEWERYQARQADPGWQAVDRGLATTGAMMLAGPVAARAVSGLPAAAAVPVRAAADLLSKHPAAAGGAASGALAALEGDDLSGIAIASALGAVGGAGAQTVGREALGRIGKIGKLIRGAFPRAAPQRVPYEPSEAMTGELRELVARAMAGGGAAAPEAATTARAATTVASSLGPQARAGIPVDQIEQRVVDWATKQKFSKRQILDMLKEDGFNQERGMASELLDLIFRKHGITRR